MLPFTDTVVDARELIGRPGTSRSLARRVAAPAGLSDDLVRVGPTVGIDGIVESVVDGLLVRASVRAPLRLACARCLREFGDELDVEVVELFTVPGRAIDDEVEPGYEVRDDAIDLDTLLRDAVADVAPLTPLCRPDCAGLCAVCGADRNAEPCGGHPEQPDPRWADLAGLQLPAGPPATSTEPGAVEPSDDPTSS